MNEQEIKEKLAEVKSEIFKLHTEGKCGGACIYCATKICIHCLPGGTLNRLNRIIELRGCSVQEAIEFSISAGWAVAEKLALKGKRPNGDSSQR